MNDFLTMQANAVSNIAYIMSNNIGILLMVIGVAGCMVLLAKEEIDTSIREEQNII